MREWGARSAKERVHEMGGNSESKMGRKGESKIAPTFPLILITAPSGARFPFNTEM
jgi:hypothetical protein